MDNIKRITKELISIESTSEKPENLKKCIDYVKAELKGYKYKEYLYKNTPSILFFNDNIGLKKGFRLILNGHLDVVKGTPDQFIPFEKEGKLYGRGSLDMKSGCAINIHLFKTLSQKVNYPLGLLLSTDEEIGGFNGALYIAQKGIKADMIIATESTDLLITRRSKGVCWLEMSTTGKPAHAAYLWKGINALEKILTATKIIKKEFVTPTKAVWETTANLSIINTNNETVNKVPDAATAKFDIRYIPEDKRFRNSQTALKYFKRLLPSDISFKFIEFEPSTLIKTDNPFIIKLKNIINSNKSVFKDGHGASDLRHFAKFGISGVEFGPKGKNLHGDDEYVDLKSIAKATEILKTFITNL